MHRSAYQFDIKQISCFINKQSSYLGCPLFCHLIHFKNQKPLLEDRKKLRRTILKYIQNSSLITPLSNEQKLTLLKPGNIPHIPDISLSISHCPGIGGFVITPFRGTSIGFDLEQIGRANKRMLSYLAKEEEIKQTPGLTALWSAKGRDV